MMQPHSATSAHLAAWCVAAGCLLAAAACSADSGAGTSATSGPSTAQETPGTRAPAEAGNAAGTAGGAPPAGDNGTAAAAPAVSDPEAAGEATTTVPSHSAPPATGDGAPVHVGDPSGLALLKQAPEWIVGIWSSQGHTVTFKEDGSGTLSVDSAGDGATVDLAFQLNSVDGTRNRGTAVAQIMSVGPRNTYRGLTLNSKVTFTFTGSVVTDSLTDNPRSRK